MTFYTLTRPGGPWDYPTLGFVAVNGAVLDGSASTPPVTSPPDAYWAVGGSAESGITRKVNNSGIPSPAEPADGSALVWSDVNNRYEPSTAALSATFARFTDDTGAPLSGKTARIVFDEFGDVTDILMEDS